MLAYTLARPFIYLFLGLCLSIASTNTYESLYSTSNWANIFVIIVFTGLFLFAYLKKLKSLALTIIGIFLFCLNDYTHLKHVHDQGHTINFLNFQTKEFKIISDNIINFKHNCIAQTFLNNREINCKISFQDTSIINPLQYGDILTGSIKLKKINGSISRAFNTYPDYLLNKHIYYEGFMHTINHIQSTTNYSIYHTANYLADQIKNVIFKTSKNPENAKLLVSLIIGDKTELSKDIKQAFISTGTAHILAVSGLHLGLIYYLLSLACKPIRTFKTKHSKLIQTIVIISGIWIFALISGLGSSILRAAVMFTIIQLATFLKRKNDSVNTLFACGFLLVAFNPCILSDIGFQLSFVAVLSIIWFNPYFRRIWNPKNKILLPIRDLFSVTCAVQVLVSPLSIFYFQQFPLYFLISNLIWIPLSFILMLFGLTQVFIFILSEQLAIFLGTISENLIHFGIVSLKFIQNTPLAILDKLWINEAQLIFILGSFIFLRFYLHTLNYSMLIKSLVFAELVCLSAYYTEYKIVNGREIIIYKDRNMLQIELRDGHHIYSSFPNSTLLSKYRSLNKINHQDSLGINEIMTLTNHIQGAEFIQQSHCSKNIYFLNQTNENKIINTKQLTELNYNCIFEEYGKIHTYLNLNFINPIIIKLNNDKINN